MALYGELALEEALDLSSDRLLNERIMPLWWCIFKRSVLKAVHIVHTLFAFWNIMRSFQ